MLKKNLSLYHIQRIILEADESFGDDSHIIYVNNKIKDNTPLGRLMHGFSCKEIAKQLDITEANAIKLDQRAKNKLLQICREEGVL